MISHLVIPDVQARPGVDLSYLSWIGQYIIAKKPEVIVCLGDFADMPSLCVAPDTLILRGDMSWTKAEDLIKGDAIIGFQQETNVGRGKSFRKMKAGVVTNNTRFVAPRGYEIITTHGRVVCSSDHKFLSYNEGGAKRQFRTCESIKVGWKIVSLGSSWQEDCGLTEQERGYLAGFLDGEGYYGNGRLAWSQNHGEVADYVLELFAKLGVPVEHYEEEDRPKIRHYYVQGSYLTSWKVLHYVRPIRLITKLLNDVEDKTCSKFSDIQDSTVLSITALTGVEVIGLETSIGTYISNSLFSHNCSYDKGKKSFEGRRYKEDIKSAHTAMELLLTPIINYNRLRIARKEKQYKPRMVLTLGNHEERIARVGELQPELDGVVGYDDLPYSKWEVYDFLDTVDIDGVIYTHYLANPMSGKPYAGSAINQLTKVGKSFIVGHKQTLDIATRFTVGGTQQWGIVAGAAYPHFEDYKGYQGNDHWRGILHLHRVANGSFDLMTISLDYLKERYNNVAV